MQAYGKYIVIAGLLIALAGLVFWLFGDKLNWIGKLPGDIRIEKENIKIYFPITTMILVSVLLSLVMWFIRRFFH
jgi:hypothetical protein